MKPVIIIAIIIPIIIGIIAVLVIPSMQEQNIESITEEEQRDELIWQQLQKTYLMQECREKWTGQADELKKCFEQIDEEQRLNPPTSLPPNPTQNCSGTARCITGTVTSVIDGDTIKVDGQSIRFALASAPELNEFNGPEARNFIDEICPVGSVATVDEDDMQTEGSYGRILGVIYCNGLNLNEELVDSGLGYLSSGFCSSSEFVDDLWAVKHGCTTSQVSIPEVTPEIQSDCDPSYPDFCIPTSPPDLDCGDIPQKRFTVLQPDPHRFDGDKDGIGCES